MRSRQLSEIRTITRILKVSTLHGNDGFQLNETNLKIANNYVYQNRIALNKIFDIKEHINDEGFPHS